MKKVVMIEIPEEYTPSSKQDGWVKNHRMLGRMYGIKCVVYYKPFGGIYGCSFGISGYYSLVNMVLTRNPRRYWRKRLVRFRKIQHIR